MEIKREYNKVNASHSLRDENPMGDNRFVVFDFRWSLMRKGLTLVYILLVFGQIFHWRQALRGLQSNFSSTAGS